jgi:hypothetical protein
MNKNQRTCFIGGLFLLLFIAGALMAKDGTQTDSSASQEVKQRKAILIAKGNSFLEEAVTKIIIDNFKSKGFRIKVSDIKELNAVVRKDYSVVLVFNAVKSSELAAPVKKFFSGIMDKEGNAESKILICSVYGELWDPKKAGVDAVTGPTRTLNPAVISEKIIQKIDAVFGDQSPAE